MDKDTFLKEYAEWYRELIEEGKTAFAEKHGLPVVATTADPYGEPPKLLWSDDMRRAMGRLMPLPAQYRVKLPPMPTYSVGVALLGYDEPEPDYCAKLMRGHYLVWREPESIGDFLRQCWYDIRFYWSDAWWGLVRVFRERSTP